LKKKKGLGFKEVNRVRVLRERERVIDKVNIKIGIIFYISRNSIR
jgi:hypothetical protein